MRTKIITGFLILALILSIGLVSCTEPTQQEEEEEPTEFPGVMKIAHIVTLSGPYAYAGLWKDHAVRQAVDEINRDYGFPFQIEVVSYDHKGGDANAAAAGMRQACDIHDVPCAITGWPAVSLAVREIGEVEHAVVINPGGIGMTLLDKPWLFNTRIFGEQMVKPLMEFFAEEYGCERVAITIVNEPGHLPWADCAYAEAPSLGMEVVEEIVHEQYQTEFASEMALIKAADPDCILVLTGSITNGYIVKQAKEMGMDIPMGVVMGIQQPMIDVAGGHFDGVYGCYMYLGWETAFANEFRANYIALYGEEPEELAANYYEAPYILAEAIEWVLANGGDPFDGLQLKEAIETIDVFPSVFGPEGTMELLPNGSVVKPAAIYQLQGDSMEDIVLIEEVPTYPLQEYPPMH